MYQRTKLISQTPTIDTAVYASGDLLTPLMTFDVGNVGDGGVIKSLMIVDLDADSPALDVLFFTSNLSNSTLTLNAAADIHDTDILTFIGHVSFVSGNWIALADSSVATRENLSLPFTTGTLYAVAVSRGTPDELTATDITFILGVMLNG